MKTIIIGLLIPFAGTTAGAACVFALKKELESGVQRALTGFGRFAFLPAFAGFWFGILFLLALDHVIPHLHRSIYQTDQVEGLKSGLSRTIMLILAVTLHNIPEGMAVGVVYAGLLYGSANITAGGALALGRFAFLPAFAGFWFGILFLLALDHVIPHLHRSIDQTDQVEGLKSGLSRSHAVCGC